MGYTVALTGGIGSGKSTVADAFTQLGVNIVDADVVARQVAEPGTPALQAIAGHFGSQMIVPGDMPNRHLLREKIFAHVGDRAWLNALLHPLIQQKTRHQMQAAISPYFLWVIPSLVESRPSGQAGRVLVVDVPKETQIERTILRDKVSREHVEHIPAAQATCGRRLAVAGDVIENTGALDAVASDVARLYEKYLMLASQATSQENS